MWVAECAVVRQRGRERRGDEGDISVLKYVAQVQRVLQWKILSPGAAAWHWTERSHRFPYFLSDFYPPFLRDEGEKKLNVGSDKENGEEET
jgi:hypothetical protein